jgi:uncharacterized protein YggL (DUF469 family)
MDLAELHTLIFAVEERLDQSDDAFSARELLNALQDEITARFVKSVTGKEV